MRKRLICLILIGVLGVSSIFIGCGNSVANKSLDQAKISIENRDYTKALSLLEITLDEEPKNEEAKKLYNIVEAYEKANKAMKDNKVEEAKKILQSINGEYINYPIKTDIDNLKTKVNTQYKEIEKNNTYLTEAKRLYEDKKYTGCKTFLCNNLLGSSENNIAPNKYLTEEQKQRALQLLNKCEEAIKGENVVKPPQVKGTKEEYLKKLNDIETNMGDVQELYNSGVTIEMKKAASLEYKRWDNMLNEIYSLLKVQLSKDEMKELENKEVNWIKYRDETAKNAANKYEGGTLAGVEYTATLARVTKERCYELVNTYMK